VADDLHALADAISDQSPRIKAFAVAVADVLQPVAQPSLVWWAGSQPPPTPTPSVTPTMPDVTDAAGLAALLREGGTLHGVVRVRPFVYSGNLDIGVSPAARSVAIFEDGFQLVGPSGSPLPAVGVHCANVELYGGDVSNPHGGSGTSGGDGVKAYNGSSDSGPVEYRWWGLTIHDTAAQGFSSQADAAGITGDVQAEITRWGLNPALDPHTVKGTGLHGAYTGGGAGPTRGRHIVYAHDGATGACWQLGAYMNGEVWASCARNTWPDALSGAGFQPWGGHNGAVTVRNLLVDTAQYGIYAGSLSSGTFTVEQYARRNVKLADVLSPHVTLPT